MTEVEIVVTHAVVRHQQPSAAPLMHGMQRHAGGRLHHQREEGLRIALDAVEEWPSPFELARKMLDGHDFDVRIGHLHHRFAANHVPSPKSALIPRKPSSPTVAISTIEPFCMTAVTDATPPLGKIDLADGLVERLEDVFDCDGTGAEVGAKPLKSARGRQASNLFFGRASAGGGRTTACASARLAPDSGGLDESGLSRTRAKAAADSKKLGRRV